METDVKTYVSYSVVGALEQKEIIFLLFLPLVHLNLSYYGALAYFYLDVTHRQSKQTLKKTEINSLEGIVVLPLSFGHPF